MILQWFSTSLNHTEPQGRKDDAQLSPGAEIQAQRQIYCVLGCADGRVTGGLSGVHGHERVEQHW